MGYRSEMPLTLRVCLLRDTLLTTWGLGKALSAGSGSSCMAAAGKVCGEQRLAGIAGGDA